jgi:hypothetical protein
MSDKLILEFYEHDCPEPLAVLLARFGGDNPASAALTIGAFLKCRQLADKLYDAGSLVSHFILWQTQLDQDPGEVESPNTVLIRKEGKYPYQLLRLRVGPTSVNIEIVTDEYSTEDEILDARVTLQALNIPFSFLSA